MSWSVITESTLLAASTLPTSTNWHMNLGTILWLAAFKIVFAPLSVTRKDLQLIFRSLVVNHWSVGCRKETWWMDTASIWTPSPRQALSWWNIFIQLFPFCLSRTSSLESDDPTTSKIQPVAYPSIPIHLLLFLLFTPAPCLVRMQSGMWTIITDPAVDVIENPGGFWTVITSNDVKRPFWMG